MNSLEHRITPSFLLRFTLPTVVMMVFNSIYTMVDGAFVSNFVGTGALSAVNIVYPLINLIFAIGIMLATGGSAVVAKQMGEGKTERARQSFSLITLAGAAAGLLLAIAGLAFTRDIVLALGANEAIYSYCYDYALYLSPFIPLGILQVLFQYLLVTAGKPNLGLIATIAGGVANIALDYVLIVPLGMGIKGAALATGIGFAIPSVACLLYFWLARGGSLFFTRPVFSFHTLLKACTNGSSEMVSNLSVAITTFLFNIMMMRYLGEDGVAAITIVLYAQFLFTAVFLGYTSGVAPLISYNYGAHNTDRLKRLYRLSMTFIVLCSVGAYALSLLLSRGVVSVFAKSGTRVFDLAIHGMSLFAVGFLFMGFNIFASGLFTAFSNGKVSAILSFLRTFVFILLAILALPPLVGVDGVWLSIPVAELLSLGVAGWYLVRLRKTYGY